MDISCAVGTVKQTEQPNYLAEGQIPLLVTFVDLSIRHALRPPSDTQRLRAHRRESKSTQYKQVQGLGKKEQSKGTERNKHRVLPATVQNSNIPERKTGHRMQDDKTLTNALLRSKITMQHSAKYQPKQALTRAVSWHRMAHRWNRSCTQTMQEKILRRRAGQKHEAPPLLPSVPGSLGAQAYAEMILTRTSCLDWILPHQEQGCEKDPPEKQRSTLRARDCIEGEAGVYHVANFDVHSELGWKVRML
eukprot:1157769-Pelagomonas_calceolata.AAC.3